MEKRQMPPPLYEGLGMIAVLLAGLVALVTALVCIGLGSVRVPLMDTVAFLFGAVPDASDGEACAAFSIICTVRLPRVLSVALTGASLSLSGAAMQGLLRNPLADGGTLGVSAGASLGAVIAIAFGFSVPSLPFAGTVLLAMLFAFLSLILTLSIAYRIDRQLSSNTIILIGVIFSMFASSLLSLIITFAPDKLRSITFWTMGSLAGSSMENVRVLFVTLSVFGAVILLHARELNAFSLGEENARHIGVNVRRTKLLLLISVSALIGVSVSIGGTIAFVGLVVPHMTRFLTGPNHRRLLIASAFFGSTFLMLCDLAARTLLRPVELPIGVVTSLIGAVLFIYIFASSRRRGNA